MVLDSGGMIPRMVCYRLGIRRVRCAVADADGQKIWRFWRRMFGMVLDSGGVIPRTACYRLGIRRVGRAVAYADGWKIWKFRIFMGWLSSGGWMRVQWDGAAKIHARNCSNCLLICCWRLLRNGWLGQSGVRYSRTAPSHLCPLPAWRGAKLCGKETLSLR